MQEDRRRVNQGTWRTRHSREQRRRRKAETSELGSDHGRRLAGNDSVESLVCRSRHECRATYAEAGQRRLDPHDLVWERPARERSTGALWIQQSRAELLHEGAREGTWRGEQDPRQYRYSGRGRDTGWRHYPQRDHGGNGGASRSSRGYGSAWTTGIAVGYCGSFSVLAVAPRHLDHGTELPRQRGLHFLD